MKHKAWLNHYEHNFEQLAEDIGNLRYDTLAEFLTLLSDKIRRDRIKDHEAGRVLLASSLQQASTALATSAAHIRMAWKFCEPHLFPKDITQYIHTSFDKTDRKTVFQWLNAFYLNWDSDTSFRLARCLLFGTNGDMERLKANLELARTDTRDLMVQAECDAQMRQVRDFSRPFGEERIE